MMNVLLLTHGKDLWSKLGFQSLIYLTFYPSYALGEDAWMQQISKLKNPFPDWSFKEIGEYEV